MKNKAKAILDQLEKCFKKPASEPTQEQFLMAQLCFSIIQNASLTGSLPLVVSLMRIHQELVKNAPFREAMELVVETVKGLYLEREY